MKHALPLVVLVLIFCFPPKSVAQQNVKDSVIDVTMLYLGGGISLPGGDLADRFGLTLSAQPGGWFKSSDNWMFNLNFAYHFGTDVKIADSLFKYLETSGGFIIDGNGSPTDVAVSERAMNLSVQVGKLFPAFGFNPNSGIFFTAGGGYLQHKIHITVLDNVAPQLNDDYRKGYDRLTGGFCLNQTIGFLNLSNKNVANFFVALEFTEAFTKSLRDYDFDLMKPDTQSRFDLMYGLKIGWILPIYGRAPKEFYYY